MNADGDVSYGLVAGPLPDEGGAPLAELEPVLVTAGSDSAAAVDAFQVGFSPDGAYVAFQGVGSACPAGQGGPGLTVLRIAAAARGGIGTAWCASVDGAGSPISTTSNGTADRIVWIAGAEGDDRLHGFRADNGQPVFTGGGPDDRMAGVRHFETLVAANGRLYVAGDGKVYAFSVGQ